MYLKHFETERLGEMGRVVGGVTLADPYRWYRLVVVYL